MAIDDSFQIPNGTEHPQTSSGMPARLAAIVSGPRSKWLILGVWVLVLTAVSPLAGRLSSVEENDAAAFLPANAESLAVSELESRFGDETMPAVVVYHRETGLTADDTATIEANRQALAERLPAAPPSLPVPSDDGRAVLYAVPLLADDDATLDHVTAIRDLVAAGDIGLTVKVTGPAGFTTDLVRVFDGIDTTLLLAAAGVVTVLLLVTYRSPFLWLIPLLTVVFANQGATAGVYGLVKGFGLTVNGQNAGILPVLVFGVGTDYALLLIARYREELRRHEDRHEAMAFALRRAGPALLASGATTPLGLLCLLVADLHPTRGLSPIGVVGILTALLAMLTLLPTLLLIGGRRLFWPFVPRMGDAAPEGSGLWAGVGGWVAGRPRPVWAGTTVVLALLTLGLIGIDTNLPQADQFRDEPEAIVGQKLIAASYPAGAAAPTTVIANTVAAEPVKVAIIGTRGVAAVQAAGEADDRTAFSVTLDAAPSTDAAFAAIERLRDRVRAVPGGEALVGGPDAQSLDIATTSARDRLLIIPLVLVVVLIVLAVLPRAIVAPLLVIGANILSFGAALGVSVLVFDRVAGFAGVEPSVPLLSFVFLVALGIDYTIFLMSRVHEEAANRGTRAGMLEGLTVTGGVITSAGLVLAATFSVLGVLPLVSMTELGFVVAFGVLLDTFIVRTILVPALTFDFARWIWWPSQRGRSRPVAAEAVAAGSTVMPR